MRIKFPYYGSFHTTYIDAAKYFFHNIKIRLFHSPLLRVLIAVILATIVLGLTLAPIASMVVEGWLRQDVEIRSKLVFRSIRERLLTVFDNPNHDITPYLEKITEDERLLALGYCSEAGRLLYATVKMPKMLDCQNINSIPIDNFDMISEDGKRAHVTSIAFGSGANSGHIVIVHDLTFIDQRSYQAKLYTIIALTGAAIGLGLLTIGVVTTILKSWMSSLQETIKGISNVTSPSWQTLYSPLNSEFRQLLNTLYEDQHFKNNINICWSPETLEHLIQQEFVNTQIIITSNREPYIHNYEENEIKLQTPASGLVSALEPVMRACHGTWIAHGSGTADKETVDRNDRIQVPPENPAYILRRVWLNESEQEGYYYGAANEGIWPLCHIAFVRPNFRDEDWDQYVSVNKKFAEVMISEANCDDPIFLIQDYHFALLPKMIRDKLPKATIITFWHIPWPNSETFSICPWRNEIMNGLLGSSILGFHTQFHCNNFMESADKFIESRLDRDNNSIILRGHETLVRPYPISIEWPPSIMSTISSIEECRNSICKKLGISQNISIAVGIERFDYTKGILDRIYAIDKLLSTFPEWRERFVLIQAAAPSRSQLRSYRDLQNDAINLVSDINIKYGINGWKPIHLLIQHHDQHEVYELFRAADICIVSSLHDGMNLVAKEFVAARDDEFGVLVLSTFAGASQELLDAIIVNPYDTKSMAAAIDKALRMSKNEQQVRMRLMREIISHNNVYGWAAQMLLHASRMRKQRRVIMTHSSDDKPLLSSDIFGAL